MLINKKLSIKTFPIHRVNFIVEQSIECCILLSFCLLTSRRRKKLKVLCLNNKSITLNLTQKLRGKDEDEAKLRFNHKALAANEKTETAER